MRFGDERGEKWGQGSLNNGRDENSTICLRAAL